MLKHFFKPKCKLTEEQFNELVSEIQIELRTEITKEVKAELKEEYEHQIKLLKRKLDDMRAENRYISNKFIKLQQEYDILKGQKLIEVKNSTDNVQQQSNLSKLAQELLDSGE